MIKLKIAGGVLAIMMLIAASLLFITKDEMVAYATAKGEIGKFDLPDGSTVTLDGESSFDYDGHNHQAPILSITGKAWIEVKAQNGKQMVIDYADIRITTTNGQFLVRQNQIGKEVIVAKGEVELARRTPRGDVVTLNLSQGEVGRILDTQKGLLKMNNRDKNYLAWINKVLDLQGMTLQEVFELMEDVYKVEITPGNIEITRCRFTGKFESKSIDEVIDAIAKRFNFTIIKSNIGYTIEGAGC